MCRRYAAPDTQQLDPDVQEWRRASLANQYNFAPTAYGPVIRAENDRPIGQPMCWGFVPDWAGSLDDLGDDVLINARADTAPDKRTYKRAFRHWRCLAPAYGFFQWERQRKGPDQPYFVCVQPLQRE